MWVLSVVKHGGYSVLVGIVLELCLDGEVIEVKCGLFSRLGL